MLERLHLKNVGPAPELEMEFAPRVNLITGDNGLGKSFLLDVAFFALTDEPLQDITPSSFTKISRKKSEKPQISTKIGQKLDISVAKTYDYEFSSQTWFDSEREVTFPKTLFERQADGSYAESKKNPYYKELFRNDKKNENTQIEETRIVIYQKTDGSFTVLEPLRSIGRGVAIFNNQQIWNGVEQNGDILSDGLIRDWATWQLENGETFQQFKAALVKLSPDENEKLEPGKLTRVSLKDTRNIPTLKMPYGQEVPITQASAGIRRIVSLAYMLVWTWEQHRWAAALMQQEPAREIVLLVDELEQHLHPRWQRVILPALLETVKELMKSDVRVQIIATTHSPMVLASLEPLYDDSQDAWFDLNLVNGTVTLERMPWRKRGDASAWLTSEAFDLPSSGSLDREGAMDRAAKVMASPKLTKKSFLEHDQALRGVLGETDPFWIRWRFMGEKKGWL